MYAIIQTGGKQYKIFVNKKLKVERISADIGSTVNLNEVLAIGTDQDIKFGTPLIKKATILAKIVMQSRHEKIKIFKMRRRKHYQKHQGHRQNYTELQILSINT